MRRFLRALRFAEEQAKQNSVCEWYSHVFFPTFFTQRTRALRMFFPQTPLTCLFGIEIVVSINYHRISILSATDIWNIISFRPTLLNKMNDSVPGMSWIMRISQRKLFYSIDCLHNTTKMQSYFFRLRKKIAHIWTIGPTGWTSQNTHDFLTVAML